MFSKTTKYAIKATIFIASEFNKGKRIGVKEISKEIDSPEAFTAKILQKLTKKRILNSFKGVGGGFTVDEDKMSSVKLIHIVEAIETEGFLQGCGLGLKNCSETHPCPFHHQYKDLKKKILKAVNDTSLNDLVKGLHEGDTFLKI